MLGFRIKFKLAMVDSIYYQLKLSDHFALICDCEFEIELKNEFDSMEH